MAMFARQGGRYSREVSNVQDIWMSWFQAALPKERGVGAKRVPAFVGLSSSIDDGVSLLVNLDDNG